MLNKMPNDCTAPAFRVPPNVQSLCEFQGSHTKLNSRSSRTKFMSRYPQRLHWVNGEFVDNLTNAKHVLDIAGGRERAYLDAASHATSQNIDQYLSGAERYLQQSRTASAWRRNIRLQRSVAAKKAAIRAEIKLLRARVPPPSSFDFVEALPEVAGIAGAGYELAKIARGPKVKVPFRNVPLAALLQPIWFHGGKELYETVTGDKLNVFTAPAQAGGPTDWSQHNHGNTQQ